MELVFAAPCAYPHEKCNDRDELVNNGGLKITVRSMGCICLATKDAVKSVGALVFMALCHSNGMANAIEDRCVCTVKVTKESGHEFSTAVCVPLNWETDLAAAPVVNFVVPLILEMNYGAEVVVCKC